MKAEFVFRKAPLLIGIVAWPNNWNKGYSINIKDPRLLSIMGLIIGIHTVKQQ
jgi:hypothetical protein